MQSFSIIPLIFSTKNFSLIFILYSNADLTPVLFDIKASSWKGLLLLKCKNYNVVQFKNVSFLHDLKNVVILGKKNGMAF